MAWLNVLSDIDISDEKSEFSWRKLLTQKMAAIVLTAEGLCQQSLCI
ncbi:hypothetical protein SX4_3769 [Vibrio mimicus SX-4]|nr:hypothetical protein SX4_3769 [Vibrio mimicus SX-4]